MPALTAQWHSSVCFIIHSRTCKCSKRPLTDSNLTSHLSQRQFPLSVDRALSFSGTRAGNRMVVGAARMGDDFDALPLESSSSSSTSSSSTGASWLISFLLSSDGESLDIASWLPGVLNALRIPPQAFVKLLFSFTCGFDKMQPLKSNDTGSPSSDGAAVEGGELHLAVPRLVSEGNLYRESENRVVSD